jgi:hypothetical protein
LVSPASFGHNAIWIRSPDQKVDTNGMTSASFGKDTSKREFANVLLYKLQKKRRSEYNDQSDVDSTFIGDSLTSFRLLLIWKLNNKHNICVRALLIRHSNTISWNEDTLEKLHSMHLPLCKDDDVIKDTWLLDDATVLMTTSKRKKEKCTFEITISEETRKCSSMEPLWIPSNM